jgi:hypothetical protein
MSSLKRSLPRRNSFASGAVGRRANPYEGGARNVAEDRFSYIPFHPNGGGYSDLDRQPQYGHHACCQHPAFNGCGANVVGRAIRGLEVGTGHAASTAFQISEAVLFLTRSLPSLN